MSVFSYEWKKLMVMQRGLCYILAALLVSTVWLAAADRPRNSAMEEYREEYEWYLEQLDGAYTEEKAAWLEQEAQAIKRPAVPAQGPRKAITADRSQRNSMSGRSRKSTRFWPMSMALKLCISNAQKNNIHQKCPLFPLNQNRKFDNRNKQHGQQKIS